MQSHDGLVGVVIPVYAHKDERLNYLNLCLTSLRRQEHPFVAVIVDDGSPRADQVRNVVNSFDDRFRFVNRARQPTDLKTSSNALNMGIDMILDQNKLVLGTNERVRAVCYLHSDDMLPPNSLRDRLSSLSPEHQLVYGRAVLIDEQSRAIGYQGSEIVSLVGSYGFFPHTSLWERDFLLNLRYYVIREYGQKGIFDERLTAAEDRDVTLSSLELLKQKNQPPSFVRTPSYYYRVHNSNISGETHESEKRRYRRIIDKKHHISWKDGTFSRLIADLPWSMGTFLPEPAKKLIRPVRNGVKRIIFGDIRPIILGDPLISV